MFDLLEEVLCVKWGTGRAPPASDSVMLRSNQMNPMSEQFSQRVKQHSIFDQGDGHATSCSNIPEVRSHVDTSQSRRGNNPSVAQMGNLTDQSLTRAGILRECDPQGMECMVSTAQVLEIGGGSQLVSESERALLSALTKSPPLTNFGVSDGP